MAKQRNHNEWFTTVSLGKRKSCPCCKAKLESGESIWSWGEYVRAKWRTVKHFCKNCFVDEVQTPLASHTGDCGCTVSLVFKGASQPDWLVMPATPACPVGNETAAAA